MTTDYEAMEKARLRYCRELGGSGVEWPGERAMAAYARGFLDALKEVANAEITEAHGPLDSEWNAAIEAAAQLVAEKYDVNEPWLEPDDVRSLKRLAATSNRD
jgi:hypothetical protein